MPSPRSSQHRSVFTVARLLILMIGMVAGALVDSFRGGVWFANTPDKAYVDSSIAKVNQSLVEMKTYVDTKSAETVKESKAYTDDRVSSVLLQLKDYSDMNRQKMENKFEPVATKVEMILDLMRSKQGKKF